MTDPAPVDARKWGRYGGRPLFVLCLVGLVDSFDRGVVPAVIEAIERDLGFGDDLAGLLGTALIVGGLLFAVPGGVLADRLDRRKLIAGVLLLWSASTGLAATAQSYWQLLGARATLGVGDAINDPAVQSLVADYYRVDVRGRAFAWQRVVPTVGLGLGTALGGLVLHFAGWRIAVLAVGVPGVLVALLVRTLPLPARGHADDVVEDVSAVLTSWASIKALLRVRSLRVLLVATAFINGILSALAFWGFAFHVRESGLSEAQAPAIAGSVILLGAIAGGVGGGIVTDKIRGRVRGAPMLMAGVVTAVGSVLLTISFIHGVPVYAVRLPLQMLGVAFVVSSLPPLTVITAEVVPPHLRGRSFGLVKLGANLLAAVMPYVIGLIASHHEILINGKPKGDLSLAFLSTTWIVLIGSVLLVRGIRHVDDDIAKALASGAN